MRSDEKPVSYIRYHSKLEKAYVIKIVRTLNMSESDFGRVAIFTLIQSFEEDYKKSIRGGITLGQLFGGKAPIYPRKRIRMNGDLVQRMPWDERP